MSQYATATTLAGKRRQVWNRKAKMTGPGGLRRKDLKENKQGKIVSKKASKLTKWQRALLEARKNDSPSFIYEKEIKGKTVKVKYVRRTRKTSNCSCGHLIYYEKA